MMTPCFILRIEVWWANSEAVLIQCIHLDEFKIKIPFVLNIASISYFLHECFYLMSLRLFILACIHQKSIEPQLSRRHCAKSCDRQRCHCDVIVVSCWTQEEVMPLWCRGTQEEAIATSDGHSSIMASKGWSWAQGNQTLNLVKLLTPLCFRFPICNRGTKLVFPMEVSDELGLGFK